MMEIAQSEHDSASGRGDTDSILGGQSQMVGFPGFPRASELGQLQLARVDRQSKAIVEAERLLAAINQQHEEYVEMTRALADPSEDNTADRLRDAVSRGLEDAKSALERFRADGVKEKVEEREKEMNDLMAQLEVNEKRLKTLAR